MTTTRTYIKTLFFILSVSLMASIASADNDNYCDPDFEFCEPTTKPEPGKCDPDFEYCPPKKKPKKRKCDPDFEYCPPKKQPKDDFKYDEAVYDALPVISEKAAKKAKRSDYRYKFNSCSSTTKRAYFLALEHGDKLCKRRGWMSDEYSARTKFRRKSKYKICIQVLVNCYNDIWWD